MSKFVSFWRIFTALWSSFGVWGEWCGRSLWGSNLTSEEKASAAFAFMAWFVALLQFFYVIYNMHKGIETRKTEWRNLFMDCVICLFSLIAFAIIEDRFSCSGYGLHFEQATFAFSLLMIVFSVLFIVPGLFRSQFVGWTEGFECKQQNCTKDEEKEGGNKGEEV
ncbi:hypothetical protein TrVE_jg10288 [Triparma verrucosa]|uniref:MARVEL domain-containing protein n=1 Tax=Triparma verrucosa TaxID=1606542 RepID=A0A9W7C6W0_9STRA|nr:hypothetical protein TrVE_jg10288 [Triparma verrucosa]